MGAQAHGRPATSNAGLPKVGVVLKGTNYDAGTLSGVTRPRVSWHLADVRQDLSVIGDDLLLLGGQPVRHGPAAAEAGRADRPGERPGGAAPRVRRLVLNARYERTVFSGGIIASPGCLRCALLGVTYGVTPDRFRPTTPPSTRPIDSSFSADTASPRKAMPTIAVELGRGIGSSCSGRCA